MTYLMWRIIKYAIYIENLKDVIKKKSVKKKYNYKNAYMIYEEGFYYW